MARTGSGAEAPGGGGDKGIRRGAALSLAAALVGLLTTLSGVAIEFTSSLFGDLRHGACFERFPGEDGPLSIASWRPFDRTQCCGGSALVDHAAQECRAVTIIQHSARKRLAYPLHPWTAVGWESSSRRAAEEVPVPGSTGALLEVSDAFGDLGTGADAKASDGSVGQVSGAALRGGHVARAERLRELVGAQTRHVRAHVSGSFEVDPWERWGEEERRVVASKGRPEGGSGSHQASALAELRRQEVAVNDGFTQTRTESVGAASPTLQWISWERSLGAHGSPAALIIHLAGSALLALLAGLVTRRHVAAAGSGIPEVKAAVAGFALPASFRGRTLGAKMLALSLCVGAGLAVGKEGPMIHIGACWGALLFAASRRLGLLDEGAASETDFLSMGAAAGVAAAFGAPLAGVLFAVEELGRTLPAGLQYSTMICAFGSAAVAALALKWLDLPGTQRLSVFEVDYKQAWAAWEALPFALLGVVGGILGAAFVIANEALHRKRLKARASGYFCWVFRSPRLMDGRVLEVVVLAVLTGMSNYPHALTRRLQADSIRALFSQCPTGPDAHFLDFAGLCASGEGAMSGLLALLFGAAMLRLVQTALTFGALVPAGLFVPSLFVGGCVGRAVGSLLASAGFAGATGALEPGIYAMVGAGAVLAGVSRLTLSLAVVLFELTGGLTYVVPFMLAVLLAKWTGDALTNGRSVYDVHAELKGLAKIEQVEDLRLPNATVEDLVLAATEVEGTANGAGAACDDEQVAPLALWTSASGHAAVRDVVALCNAARGGGGLPVLAAASAAGDEEVRVLGWLRAEDVLQRLPSAEKLEAEPALAPRRCCFLSASTAGGSGVAGAIASGMLRKALASDSPKGWSAAAVNAALAEEDDFSDLVEAASVVRVRRDCSLLAAYCIFEGMPRCRALVAVDEARPGSTRAVTRELFESRLRAAAFCAGQQGSNRSRPVATPSL